MEEISQDILRRAAGGDLDAFGQIYKAFSGFVYGVALRFVRNTADAEEITQDVFVKIHKHLGGFREQSAFKTWVYRITMNTAFDCVKKRARDQNRREDFDAVIETQEVPAEAEGRLLQEDREKMVHELLGWLGPDQRACIILREIEGLDYRQIAEALGININTVRTRLKRGREALLHLNKKGVVRHEV